MAWSRNSIHFDALGEPYGFTLHGMAYLFTEYPQKGEAGKPCKAILASEVHKRRLRDVISEGTLTLAVLEHLAVSCIREYYWHMEFSMSETNLCVHGNKKAVVSTDRGSIAIVTDTGGIYNLIATDPRDVFVFERFLDEFPNNYGIAALGSRTQMFYEKLGYDIEDIDEDNSLVSLVRFNFKGEQPDLTKVLNELGLTIWSFEDESAISIHPYTE